MVPDLTVVVPTRNERDNIAPLLRRLERVRPELDVEVLFVDDSTDETPEVIEIEARRSSRRVAVIHRSGGERAGGLGGAVQAGMVAARGRLVCVMDADLQHPPELLGALLDAGQGPDVDVVVASRYCERGEVGEFSTLRTLLSRASARAAKLLFPRRLRAVSDPMSGYFLIRRSSLDVVALRPRGFKILLEILVSGHTFTVAEVPFRFGERRAGDSKASVREGLRYLRRLIELRTLGQPRRFAGVAGVGALGVAVNTGVLDLLCRTAGLWFVTASIVATQVAILFNYGMTERFVFRGRESARTPFSRLVGYVLANNASLLLSAPLLIVLVSALGLGVSVANVISLALLVVVRFVVADRYIWGSKRIGWGKRRRAFAAS